MAKYSKQREAIFEYLKTHRTHPKAEQIFADLKQSNPTLSLATVYRNLKMFCEENRVQVITASDGTFCYDGDISRHHHFECKDCGKIYDVDSAELSDEVEASAENVGKIDGYSLVFYGVCNNCIK